MQAYLCEYASDDAFIGEVFRCVEAFLAEMYSGAELVTARGRYFTADEKGVGEYSEQYDMLTRIYEINSRSRFPFTSSNMPPGTHYVHYYDEKAGLPCDAVSYSDCGEIALYNFFCCVLYDPVARSYSTKHLEEKNCAPTVRFKHFFTEVCTAPGDNTKACIHQEWARVAQGLVLPPAADNKAEVAGAQTTRSLIKYSKSVTDAVSVALKADIGTFLMALAEIAGLPAAVKKDLADTVGELLAFPPGNVDCAKLAQLFNEVVNTRISTRAAKVDLYNVKVGVDKEEEKILSGSIVLSFPPQEDGQPCYEIKLEFSFDPRHVDTFYKPNDVTLDNDDRKFFAVRDRTMGDRNGPLSGLIRDCVKRFLSKADGTLLPSDHIAGVESAHDPKALYTALSRWLCYTPMYSEPDRLAAIDQLFPAFMRLLKQRRTILSASNPLVLLIANILGSVALNDAETRDCFLRAVFTHCTGDREELFPGIRIQPPLYHTEPDACAVCPSELGFWRLSGFRVPNIALEYLRQVAVACSAQSSVVPEEASIVKLLEQLYDTRGYGYRVVNMFMTYRCVEAVELLRGYCMLDMPDEDDGVWRWMVRRVFWFCLALENRIYSEVRWACGVWDERKFTKFREILADRDLDTPGELPPLSEHIVAKVFPDGPSSAQLVILLGLYAQLALFKADYGEIVYRALENNTLQAAPRFVIVDICQASVFAFLGHCCTYSRTQSKGGTRANLMLLKSDLEDLKSFVNKIEQFYQAKEKLPDKLNRVLRDCRLKLADSDTELQKVPEMPALPQ
ncbi:hypothetical protein PAPHI01_1156 [Pancytospora philotis]|nr:hypothetical protein PAPHI01_1156 [Pancytospora philotis]